MDDYDELTRNYVKTELASLMRSTFSTRVAPLWRTRICLSCLTPEDGHLRELALSSCGCWPMCIWHYWAGC